MIEQITASGDSRSAEEYLSMTVRPIPNPLNANTEIAHFYKDVATSTFIVKRAGNSGSMTVYGRNETPNNKNVDLHDKIRNTLVALLARIGLAGPQWKKLARGLLNPHEETNE